MKMLGAKLLLAAALLLAPVTQVYSQVSVDPGLPVYTPSEKPAAGNIRVSGSMTLAQQTAVWAESFRKTHPNVDFTLVSTGSRSAIPDLIEGKVDFSLLSRPISQEEIKQFNDKFGYLPTIITPASEQIGIIVNKNNPLESLNLEQLDGIFSKTPRRGAAAQLKTWGDVGVTGELASKPISLQGRRDETGLQLFFQHAVMLNSEFGEGLAEHETTQAAIDAVANDPAAITFGSANTSNDKVKILPIVFIEGQEPISATSPNYLISRPLMFVINCPPGKTINPLTKDFINYVFSRDGQYDVVSRGLVPIKSVTAQSSLEALGDHTEN